MVHYREPAGFDAVLAAIGDPTRRAIINWLTRGPARISDIAARFSMSLTGFIKHVKVLEGAGLVRRTRSGRENTLTLEAQPLCEVARWAFEYAPYWESRLERFEAYFASRKESKR